MAKKNILKKRFDVENIDVIDKAIIDIFNYEFPGKRIEINIETNEFTHVCPWSGLPDFANLKITYVPDRKCIELKSLKYYLHSYRNVGVFYEHVINKILEDLIEVVDPLEMFVEAEFNIRGGLKTTVKRSYTKEQKN
ncbi:MAG: preQ(1) synthase [Acidobacteriota bacterium]